MVGSDDRRSPQAVRGLSLSHQEGTDQLSFGSQSGELKVVSLGCDFFLVKFSNEEDRAVTINDGPWTVS